MIPAGMWPSEVHLHGWHSPVAAIRAAYGYEDEPAQGPEVPPSVERKRHNGPYLLTFGPLDEAVRYHEARKTNALPVKP
jgi:hypothetical protein